MCNLAQGFETSSSLCYNIIKKIEVFDTKKCIYWKKMIRYTITKTQL